MKSVVESRWTSAICAARSSVMWLGSPDGRTAQIGQTWATTILTLILSVQLAYFNIHLLQDNLGSQNMSQQEHWPSTYIPQHHKEYVKARVFQMLVIMESLSI